MLTTIKQTWALHSSPGLFVSARPVKDVSLFLEKAWLDRNGARVTTARLA